MKIGKRWLGTGDVQLQGRWHKGFQTPFRPLYFMRYAQFYALAIFVMDRLPPPCAMVCMTYINFILRNKGRSDVFSLLLHIAITIA